MLQRFGRAFMKATKTFREEFVTSEVLDSDNFEGFDARSVRYDMQWASYENTAYRNIHRWSTAVRNRYGLYKYIRNIYNPTYRNGEFWRMMLWGGALDPDAGDKGAIPIEVGDGVNEDGLRQAIAHLWEISNWDVNKGICTLWGSILGDAAIRVVDDREKEQARMELVHPGTLSEVVADKRGFVKAYEIVEEREFEGREVTYRENAEREGDNVVYRTYLNDKPFAWNGIASEWSEPYGFIPLVVIQHNNVGLKWGWSEMHAARSKIMELDDMASKLHDHIRKMVDPVWMANFSKPKDTPNLTASAATTDRPQPGREELPTMYVNDPNAKMQPLVVEGLDIEKVSNEVTNGLAELERDYPELQMDIWTTSGDVSGKALRTARQRAERKVIDRRTNYDSPLVRAQQMALAIGGEMGYPGFEGFNLQSYDAGQLDHRVGDRPVFDSDPIDTIEEKKTFWETVKVATDAGVSVEAALMDLGWSEEQVSKIYSGLPEQ